MVAIPLPLVERRVCVRVREREREGEGGREREASFSDAVRVEPTWLQRHGCEFVTDVALEARGSGHTKAERGTSDCISMPGQGQAKGDTVCKRQACYMPGSDPRQNGHKEQTKWV